MLLATITIDGIEYNGSIRGFAGERFYYPWVKRIPTLELGQVQDSGKVGAQFGQITLTNDFTNKDHPFYGERYKTLLSEQRLYDIKLQYKETGNFIFTGNIFLTNSNETDLTFTLTDLSFTLGSREFSIVEGFSFVENISVINNQPAQITAQSHNLVTGQFICFEQMNNIGELLQYSGPPTDNFFVVGSVISNNVFTIQTKDFTPVTLASEIGSTGSYTPDSETHRVGLAQRVPFSWGAVVNVTPVIKKRSNEVANPNLVLNSSTHPIEIRENGVLIYSTDSTSTQYWNGPNGSGTAPTSTTIVLNQNTSGGVLSISGVSARGETLQQFFTYVAGQLGLSVNLSKTS